MVFPNPNDLNKLGFYDNFKLGPIYAECLHAKILWVAFSFVINWLTHLSHRHQIGLTLHHNVIIFFMVYKRDIGLYPIYIVYIFFVIK